MQNIRENKYIKLASLFYLLTIINCDTQPPITEPDNKNLEELTQNEIKEPKVTVLSNESDTSLQIVKEDYPTRVSNPHKILVDHEGKVIQELKDVTYCYSTTINAGEPGKIWGWWGPGTTAVIVFNLNKEFAEQYTIKNLRFTSEDPGKFIANLYTKKNLGYPTVTQRHDKASRKGATHSDAFGTGIYNNNAKKQYDNGYLSRTVASHYENGQWNPILAEIDVLDKNNEHITGSPFKIQLSSKMYHDFIKLIHEEFSSKRSEIIEELPLPLPKNNE